MSPSVKAPLVAAAASAGLILAYLGFGGASYDPNAVADPCETRDATVLEDRSTFEGIALSSLDGAACELRVTREELTLALADEQSTAEFADRYGVDEQAVEDAVRAGLIRSVDDAIAAGRIDGLDATILREVAERAPVGPAIAGLQAVSDDDSIQGLIELLGELDGMDLPGIEDIPGSEELEEILP